MLQGLSYSKIMSKTSILCIVLGVGIVGTGIESARLQTILHSFLSDMRMFQPPSFQFLDLATGIVPLSIQMSMELDISEWCMFIDCNVSSYQENI